VPKELQQSAQAGSASPEEVASVILGLATTMTFVNGTVIPVDGDSML
jgi:NAD(P)-dependent dehydrogenase (short-subunit alcohol dehydrogenase family)